MPLTTQVIMVQNTGEAGATDYLTSLIVIKGSDLVRLIEDALSDWISSSRLIELKIPQPLVHELADDIGIPGLSCTSIISCMTGILKKSK